MPRRNGSYFGFAVSPTQLVASGIWRVREAEENLRVNKWPATPGVPGSPVGNPGNAQVSLTWSAPTLGTPPTDYQVQYSSNSGTSWTTFSDATSAATSAVVTGLTNETDYIFRVRAVNALGTGPYGAASGVVTPTEIPVLPSLAGALIGVYSTRRAVSTYSGPLFRLRRASDEAEIDVPANYSGISAWIGGSSAGVVTWYDQSSNASHLTADAPVSFDLDGDSSTGSRPFVQIGPSAILYGSTAGLNGVNNAVLSAVLAPIGSQNGGGNYVDRAVIYFNENGPWGTVAFGCRASNASWRFGTGDYGNAGGVVARTSSSTSICVATVERYSYAEKFFLNGGQIGDTYYPPENSIGNTGSFLQIGGGDSDGGPDAKVCEVLVYANNAAGEAVGIAGNQQARFGL